MNEGSEFQTDGAAHRKARFASSVLVNGAVNSKVSDVRVSRRLRFRFVQFIAIVTSALTVEHNN